MIEKRKQIRLRAPIGLVYRPLKKSGRNRDMLTLVRNISGGGLSFDAKQELKEGQLIDMKIHIPHLEEPIHAVGEVVWTYAAPRKASAGEPLETGARFKDLSPRDLNRILEYVHSIGIGQ